MSSHTQSVKSMNDVPLTSYPPVSQSYDKYTGKTAGWKWGFVILIFIIGFFMFIQVCAVESSNWDPIGLVGSSQQSSGGDAEMGLGITLFFGVLMMFLTFYYIVTRKQKSSYSEQLSTSGDLYGSYVVNPAENAVFDSKGWGSQLDSMVSKAASGGLSKEEIYSIVTNKVGAPLCPISGKGGKGGKGGKRGKRVKKIIKRKSMNGLDDLLNDIDDSDDEYDIKYNSDSDSNSESDSDLE